MGLNDPYASPFVSTAMDHCLAFLRRGEPHVAEQPLDQRPDGEPGSAPNVVEMADFPVVSTRFELLPYFGENVSRPQFTSQPGTQAAVDRGRRRLPHEPVSGHAKPVRREPFAERPVFGHRRDRSRPAHRHHDLAGVAGDALTGPPRHAQAAQLNPSVGIRIREVSGTNHDRNSGSPPNRSTWASLPEPPSRTP